jgi:predicted RNase H-like HicB family nuclease
MASVRTPLKINLEWDTKDQVWVSSIPVLGNLSTYGETLEEVIAQTREAILGYLETAAEQRLPLLADAAMLRAALERRPATV